MKEWTEKEIANRIVDLEDISGCVAGRHCLAIMLEMRNDLKAQMEAIKKDAEEEINNAEKIVNYYRNKEELATKRADDAVEEMRRMGLMMEHMNNHLERIKRNVQLDRTANYRRVYAYDSIHDAGKGEVEGG